MVLNARQCSKQFFLSFMRNLWNRYHYYLHFTGKKTQLRKDAITSQGKKLANRDPGFEFKSSGFSDMFLTATHVHRSAGSAQGHVALVTTEHRSRHKRPPAGNSPNTFRYLVHWKEWRHLRGLPRKGDRNNRNKCRVFLPPICAFYKALSV